MLEDKYILRSSCFIQYTDNAEDLKIFCPEIEYVYGILPVLVTPNGHQTLRKSDYIVNIADSFHIFSENSFHKAFEVVE